MGLCRPFSLIWLESSDNSLSNLLRGSQKKTYQKMLGLAHMQKEKENQEHVPLSQLDLLWAWILALPIYTNLRHDICQFFYTSAYLTRKKISCENALISASLAIKEANLNIKHKSSLYQNLTKSNINVFAITLKENYHKKLYPDLK